MFLEIIDRLFNNKICCSYHLVSYAGLFDMNKEKRVRSDKDLENRYRHINICELMNLINKNKDNCEKIGWLHLKQNKLTKAFDFIKPIQV